jgi:hypothetical protein
LPRILLLVAEPDDADSTAATAPRVILVTVEGWKRLVVPAMEPSLAAEPPVTPLGVPTRTVALGWKRPLGGRVVVPVMVGGLKPP